MLPMLMPLQTPFCDFGLVTMQRQMGFMPFAFYAHCALRIAYTDTAYPKPEKNNGRVIVSARINL
jgi:hypothetical protein